MKADRKLEELEADFEKILQDEPTVKCSNAADERGMETSQIVKSLIVRKDGELFHLCLPGDREVSEGKFGSYRLVEKEKSREVTGQKSGTVHPFASDLPHVFDERVFEGEKLSFTVGTEIEAVKISPEELENALERASFGFEIRDIVVSSEEDIQQLQEAGLEEEDARFVTESGYRSVALDLADSFDPDMVVDTLREFRRNELEIEAEEVRQVLHETENQTHMQKMVEKLAETGEIDPGEDTDLETVVEQVLEENPDAVEDYREGTDSALNYLLGQVMQETNGKADGERARQALEEKL